MSVYLDTRTSKSCISSDIGGGDGGGGAGFYGTLFARKDRDTVIEQSGSGYSNRTVTVFREAV